MTVFKEFENYLLNISPNFINGYILPIFYQLFSNKILVIKKYCFSRDYEEIPFNISTWLYGNENYTIFLVNDIQINSFITVYIKNRKMLFSYQIYHRKYKLHNFLSLFRDYELRPIKWEPIIERIMFEKI